jgi:hypothetical protein
MDKKSCDCPYKKSCHSIRQKLQAEMREKYKSTIENCPFHKELKELYEAKLLFDSRCNNDR